MKKIAIIRIKGKVGLPIKVKDTLQMLRLFNKHTCTIVENNPNYIGMIKKVKDYITWGELDEETFSLLLTKRGKLPGNKLLEESYIEEKTKLSLKDYVKEYFEGNKNLKDIPGLKSFFRLKPPEKGFEKEGIKKHYIVGGALGDRSKDVNKLIQRMI